MSSRRNERKKSSISIAEPRSAAAPCGRGEAHPRATRHRCRRREQRKFRSRHLRKGRFSDVDLSDFNTISDKFSGGNGSSSKCLLCLRVGDIKDVGWKYIYDWWQGLMTDFLWSVWFELFLVVLFQDDFMQILTANLMVRLPWFLWWSFLSRRDAWVDEQVCHRADHTRIGPLPETQTLKKKPTYPKNPKNPIEQPC